MGFHKFLATEKLMRAIVHCAIAILVLALLTIATLRLNLNLTTSSLLYVVVVALLARLGDFVPSVIAAVVAAALLLYLAPPADSFRVADPLDVVAISAFLVVALVIAELVTKLRRMADEALSSVDRKLVDAEDRVRGRIGRHLDNDIAQRLAMVCVELTRVSTVLQDQAGKLPNSINALQQQTAKIANDIMTLSHELRSHRIEYLGIEPVVSRFCRDFGDQQKTEILFNSHDLPSSKCLPVSASLPLFQVLQEALDNAAKHSGSRQIEVGLFGASGAIHLIVHDSGIGFDPTAAVRGPGLGLVSMRERLKLVNGQLSIDSQPSAGTTIHACVPFQEGDAEDSQNDRLMLLSTDKTQSTPGKSNNRT